MWSNAGMANRRGSRKSTPPVSTLSWLGLAWRGCEIRTLCQTCTDDDDDDDDDDDNNNNNNNEN